MIGAFEKPVNYAGDDATLLEKQMAQRSPGSMSMDMRLMLERFQSDGMEASREEVSEMTTWLGRAPRT